MTVDFKRTSDQISREITAEVEQLQRELMVSRGHGEKGTNAIFNVIMVVVVLAGQFAFTFIFERPDAKKTSEPSAHLSQLSDRDKGIVGAQLGRIDDQTIAIQNSKSRAAPNLAIDGNLAAIAASVADTRRMLGIVTQTPVNKATTSE